MGATVGGCSSLTSAVLPRNITSLGEALFRDCSGLTAVKLPEGITEIGYYAFDNCSAPTSIALPDSVTDITFRGTKEEWLAIQKDEKWANGTGAFLIHCTDGDIRKS